MRNSHKKKKKRQRERETLQNRVEKLLPSHPVLQPHPHPTQIRAALLRSRCSSLAAGGCRCRWVTKPWAEGGQGWVGWWNGMGLSGEMICNDPNCSAWCRSGFWSKGLFSRGVYSRGVGVQGVHPLWGCSPFYWSAFYWVSVPREELITELMLSVGTK